MEYSKQQQSKMKSLHFKIKNSNNKLTNLFRFIEAFAFLLFIISRFSFSFAHQQQQLPSFSAVVKFSGDYFRTIALTVLSPKFVFLIGNLIILILFLKSRHSSSENGKSDSCYENYVKSCEIVTSSSNSIVTSSSNMTVNDADIKKKKPKIYRRSRSENPIIIRGKCEEEKTTYGELRRSVTEIGRSERFGDGGDTAAARRRCLKEELSSEDFRRTVEEFIARQQKILRDEEFSPMVYIGA